MIDKIESLEPSEPYIRLACRGASLWNRWIRTGFKDAEAKHFPALSERLVDAREGYDRASSPFDGVVPLSAHDAAELANELNLDRLPSYDQPPNFDKVDFTSKRLRNIHFADFIFAHSLDAERGLGDDEQMASVTFRSAKFGDQIWFVGATFGGFTDFSDATFGDGALFSDSTFLGDAYFTGAKFSSRADFSGVLFLRSVDFSDVAFGDFAHFEGAVFRDRLDVDRANFGDFASFSGTTFGHSTTFVGTIFKGKASFDGWNNEEIDKWARWRPGCGSAEGNEVIKRAATRVANGHPCQMHRVSFRLAHFRGFSSFKNREFTADTDFSSVIFEDVPDFAMSSGFIHFDFSEVAISFGGRPASTTRQPNAAAILRQLTLNWTTDSAIESRLRRL